MQTDLMQRERPATWLATTERPRFDLAERKIDEKVQAERDAQARERALREIARERALFQLD